ncbi:ATP-grasp domain-containing protein [Legionella drozanskii]|uniref:Putative Glutathione synthetase ATP-binding domain-like protein n=1 Tax=Legionella drozanskii LLAP-1 TaxID=1212489 RepID=A0A0W0SLX6_9GAMM|nr:hypothetical protein [Legionella drozanskii]KTC84418.1 putative Glutathione synthetase ATP-binding domain-like protein [Legionella drozanskii LLAP-1]
MKVYIFIYNVVAIKATLSELTYDKDAQFILIGSDYCLENLSDKNRAFFHQTHCIKRNFHQVNLQEIETIIRDYLKHYEPHQIVLLSNEDSTQIACAKLREKYNIQGDTLNQVLPYVNKDISKSKLMGKVKVPQFTLFDKEAYQASPKAYQQELVEKLGFPMFIKPIDLVSSIGTYYIPDYSALESALARIHQEPWQFEIDEFIEGELFHCDLIVKNDEIKFFMAGKYANPLAEFSKGRPMGSIPVGDEDFLAKLKQFSQSVLSHLGSFSSAFHLEMFLEKKSGELVFLEAAARTPGALVPEMYEIIFNLHLENLHYLAKIGLEEIKAQPLSGYQAGWITYPRVEGEIGDIQLPDVNVQHQMMNYIKKGEQLKKAHSLLDSACSVVFWDHCYSAIENTFHQLKAHQPLLLKNADFVS